MRGGGLGWVALCNVQFRLKQSCEQKNESLTPDLRQTGHCNVPAGSI